MTRIAVLILLLFAVTAAWAEAGPGTDMRQPRFQSANLPASAIVLGTKAATTLATLPPEDKPKTHWPWWLRILAVIGVLVFIRLVAGSMRNKPTGPPPV